MHKVYLVIPNRGAIYLFYTNTTKKKPILEAIVGSGLFGFS